MQPFAYARSDTNIDAAPLLIRDVLRRRPTTYPVKEAAGVRAARRDMANIFTEGGVTPGGQE